MNLVNVVLLALLQGATELFPISSLGHTVLLPGFLGQNDLLQSATFLPLVVTLHLGTSAALLTFFWRDWVDLLRGGLRVVVAGKFTREVDPDGSGRQLALVVVGTIPTGLIGLLLQHPLESLFSQPIIAAAFLVANGAVLLTAERLYRGQQRKALAVARARGMPTGEVGATIDEMSFGQAAVIGFAQSFALIPGISRSGSTMVAGMMNGLSHEASARFSFLLATPIILAAGVLEVPKLLHQGKTVLLLAGIGGVVSFVTAYLSVRFLMKYFETRRLDPFAYYCVALGLVGFVYFLLKYLGVL